MAVTKLIQVTNISPGISEEQMLTLFGFVGKIEAMCMYPSFQALEAAPNSSKICYIKFFDAACVGVSQYLTNTVFNDRALVVTPVDDGQIPDEEKAREMAAQVGLPPAVTKQPDKPKSEIVNLLEGIPPNQVIVSYDPRLEELGLPKYPPLPATYEGTVIEEIRRTVLIIDINMQVTSEELIQFFEKAGDIKYMKFCSRSDNIRYALIEFTDQSHVIEALKMNGLKLKDKTMKVYHSTQAITKPETKSNEVAQREVVEALTRVKEAESLILAAIDPSLNLGKSKKGRSRSKSPRRSRLRRSRSRSRRRSRSPHRRRASPTRSHQRKPRSKSPRRPRKSRSKSPTRSQRKSRSRSPRTKRNSRSKSPRSKKKSRSKSPPRSKRQSRSKSPARVKKRSQTKSPPKNKRKSRSRSPSRLKRKSRSRSPRSKYRSRTMPSKSSLSRDKLKNAYRYPGRRSENDVKKREKERERGKERDRNDCKRYIKNGDRLKRSEKEENDKKSKLKHSRDKNDGKENGNYSSQTEEALESFHSNESKLVKENNATESFEGKIKITNDRNADATVSFNWTDSYENDLQSVQNFEVDTSANNISVLTGINNDFKPQGLNCVGNNSILDTDMPCDSFPGKSGSEENIERSYDECSFVVERSRCRSNSLSGSVSPHSLPTLVICDTHSYSPVELL